MDGGLNFGGYSSGKYLDDVKGTKRMAGEIFQDVFGDEDWNKGVFKKDPPPEINVNRNPALDYVAAKAKEK